MGAGMAGTDRTLRAGILISVGFISSGGICRTDLARTGSFFVAEGDTVILINLIFITLCDTH
jgi:hypothetical protein